MTGKAPASGGTPRGCQSHCVCSLFLAISTFPSTLSQLSTCPTCRGPTEATDHRHAQDLPATLGWGEPVLWRTQDLAPCPSSALGPRDLKGIGGMALRVSGVFGKVTCAPCSSARLSGLRVHSRTSGKDISRKRAVLNPAVWISCRPASPLQSFI